MSNAFAFPDIPAPGRSGTRVAALAGLAVAVTAAIAVLVGLTSRHHGTVAPTVTPRAAHVLRQHHAARTAASPRVTRHAHTGLPAPARTPVMVLNANGVSGAAGTLAVKLNGLGYPTPTVTNAARSGVPPTIMYAHGYGPAARALARRIGGIRYVTPLDGITPDELHGAKLVVYV